LRAVEVGRLEKERSTHHYRSSGASDLERRDQVAPRAGNDLGPQWLIHDVILPERDPAAADGPENGLVIIGVGTDLDENLTRPDQPPIQEVADRKVSLTLSHETGEEVYLHLRHSGIRSRQAFEELDEESLRGTGCQRSHFRSAHFEQLIEARGDEMVYAV